jgi:thioredoxin reductase (NADPH)
MEKISKHYDVVIIGAGPAGLSAGVYASRSRLKTLIIEKMGAGGQAAIADWIENYPGFGEGISGFDLAQKMETQAKNFGTEFVFDEIAEVSKRNGTFLIKSEQNSYHAKTIILATGTKHRMLGVPGEKEFIGSGVSFCATCDAPFFRDKNVMVVGGGNSAIQEALYLTKFAANVSIVHRRDELRATKILQERAFANSKIQFIWSSVIIEFLGKERLESAKIQNVLTKNETNVQIDGAFIFAGLLPNTNFLNDFIKLDESGYILTNDEMATSVPGIFACGDVRKKLLRQVVTAAGDGAVAAFSAQEYISNHI